MDINIKLSAFWLLSAICWTIGVLVLNFEPIFLINTIINGTTSLVYFLAWQRDKNSNNIEQYEFKMVKIYDTYIKTQPLEYQKQGWEMVAMSEPIYQSGTGEYIRVTLKRKVNEKE